MASEHLRLLGREVSRLDELGDGVAHVVGSSIEVDGLIEHVSVPRHPACAFFAGVHPRTPGDQGDDAKTDDSDQPHTEASQHRHLRLAETRSGVSLRGWNSKDMAVKNDE
jgi:hypothetical protein